MMFKWMKMGSNERKVTKMDGNLVKCNNFNVLVMNIVQ